MMCPRHRTKIVAEYQEAERRGAQERHQVRQALDILAMDFDEFEEAGARPEAGVHGRMGGFHQGRLSHAARAP